MLNIEITRQHETTQEAKPMNAEGTGAPFREGSNLALLVTTVVIYGGVLVAILVDPTNPFLAGGSLVAAVVLQVIALIVIHIALAAGTRQEPDDERDTAIELRSTRFSQYILGGGVMVAVFAIIVQQVMRTPGEAALEAGRLAESANALASLGETPLWLHPMIVGHFLLFTFVLSEIVRFATRAIDYRRGL